MRTICIAATAAGLIFSPMASAQTLAPGKPAGVHIARHGASTGLLIIGGIAVAAAVGVLALGSNSTNANSGVVNVGAAVSTS